MCFEDFKSIPGDGQHSTRSDRRQQAQSFYTRRRATNRRLPKRKPQYIHLGDTRPIGKSKILISFRIKDYKVQIEIQINRHTNLKTLKIIGSKRENMKNSRKLQGVLSSKSLRNQISEKMKLRLIKF